MIDLKKEEELKIMAEGGKRLSEVLGEVITKIRPGITGKTLDEVARSLIKKKGGMSSFKTVPGYKYTTCLCINSIVVHGIPTDDPLKKGDIIGLDIGMIYKGFHTDMSWTVEVGDKKSDNFLSTGKKALREAIKEAKIGNHIGHISNTIEKIIKDKGYSPIKVLVGHGIGRNLHEEPAIPCFLRGEIKNTPLIQEGMALAIEVMYNQGKGEVRYKNNDGWTIVTRDGSLSGLFEHTVAITKEGPIILTRSGKFDTITALNTY